VCVYLPNVHQLFCSGDSKEKRGSGSSKSRRRDKSRSRSRSTDRKNKTDDSGLPFDPSNLDKVRNKICESSVLMCYFW
jgi:hypothetical protein